MPSATSRVRLRQAVLVAVDLGQAAARLRTAGRQLQRRGDGGYMVIFDIAGKDDFEGSALARAALGVRAVWRIELGGIETIEGAWVRCGTAVSEHEEGMTEIAVRLPKGPEGDWKSIELGGVSVRRLSIPDHLRSQHAGSTS
jgi:hypothetical protein